jgi:hypothetical protein
MSRISEHGTPKFKSIQSENDEDIIKTNLQSQHRSGVGMLLNLLIGLA